MEQYTLKSDIKTACITASSFPHGVLAAHQKLHALYPPQQGRKYYGISYLNGKGHIVYKAAVQLFNDAEANDLEIFIIRKGEYIGEEVHNFTNDVQSIGRSFKKLLTQPNIDPKGYCLELYLNDNDVQCMVKLSDE